MQMVCQEVLGASVVFVPCACALRCASTGVVRACATQACA